MATDREAKFIVAHEIGKRDERTTDIFSRDLSERVESWVQIFTDGYTHYRTAIPRHFGNRANFAQVIKHFEDDTNEEHKIRPTNN